MNHNGDVYNEDVSVHKVIKQSLALETAPPLNLNCIRLPDVVMYNDAESDVDVENPYTFANNSPWIFVDPQCMLTPDEPAMAGSRYMRGLKLLFTGQCENFQIKITFNDRDYVLHTFGVPFKKLTKGEDYMLYVQIQEHLASSFRIMSWLNRVTPHIIRCDVPAETGHNEIRVYIKGDIDGVVSVKRGF